jgi:hypothetical protein
MVRSLVAYESFIASPEDGRVPKQLTLMSRSVPVYNKMMQALMACSASMSAQSKPLAPTASQASLASSSSSSQAPSVLFLIIAYKLSQCLIVVDGQKSTGIAMARSKSFFDSRVHLMTLSTETISARRVTSDMRQPHIYGANTSRGVAPPPTNIKAKNPFQARKK